MISNHAYQAISELDLEPIKRKLMHPQAGEGWDLAKATSVETEYRRFLYLMKAYPDVPTAPLVDVDTFWHYHILDTMKYAADCEHAFGYFLHHFPYLGLRGEDDEQALEAAGDSMRALYETVFGERYGQHVAAWNGNGGKGQSAAAANAAWCCKSDTPVVPQAAWCCKADPAGMGQAGWGAVSDRPCVEAKAAWCCKGDTAAGAAGGAALTAAVKAAWCCKAEPAIDANAAKAAWCCKADPVNEANEAKAAWCCKADPVVEAKTVTASRQVRKEAAAA